MGVKLNVQVFLKGWRGDEVDGIKHFLMIKCLEKHNLHDLYHFLVMIFGQLGYNKKLPADFIPVERIANICAVADIKYNLGTINGREHVAAVVPLKPKITI